MERRQNRGSVPPQGERRRRRERPATNAVANGPSAKQSDAALLKKTESLAKAHNQAVERKLRHERTRQLKEERSSEVQPAARQSEVPRPGAKVRAKARQVRGGGRLSDEGFYGPTEVDQSPVSSDATPGHVPGAMDLVAFALDELLRDAREGWARLEGGERGAASSAFLCLIAAFLPWTTVQPIGVVPGFLAGGVLHIACACACLALLWRRLALTHPRTAGLMDGRRRRALVSRVAILHVVLGALSTSLGTIVLLYLGWVRLPVRFGLYVAILGGAGLAMGGLAHFTMQADRKS